MEVAAKLASGVTIDLGASSEPGDYWTNCFAGTFAEEPGQTSCLYGTLVLTDGSQYMWGAGTESSLGFAGALRILSQAPTLEEAIERLTQRCTRPEVEYDFQYSCSLH